MHACTAVSLDQLLSLRDGEPVAADVASHAEECAACARELKRLQDLKTDLASLPELTPPAYDPAALRKSASRANMRGQRWSIAAAAASVSAMAVLLILVSSSRTDRQVLMTSDGQASMTQEPMQDDPAGANAVASLVIRSQELESRLRQLPRRPHIERGGTAITISALQNRIQWVDYQLSLADEVGMSERQSTQLWQDRVQLMDTLVAVRYAEAQRLADLQ